MGSGQIDFLGKRYFFFAISILLTAWSIYLWVVQGEAKYGIDFRGGYELIVQADKTANAQEIRQVLEKGGFDDVLVQAFEAASYEFAIRIPTNEGTGNLQDKILSELKGKYGSSLTISKSNFVGPTIGKELRHKAMWAVGLGVLGILLYLTMRFEFAFALGAVVAVFHDVVISTGVYLAAGHTVGMSTIAAALTILGYSVNDTIVIFDKVREELAKKGSYKLVDVLNDSINSMLSRTIVTSGLTFISAIALLVLGGGELSDLSLFLSAGIVCGTYSTIFIASPVVLAWEQWRTRR
jgi:preprotein translocase subunit SecF